MYHTHILFFEKYTRILRYSIFLYAYIVELWSQDNDCSFSLRLRPATVAMYGAEF